MDSIIASGLRGIQSGLQSANKNAERLTKAFLPDSEEDPISSIVGLKNDAVQIKLSTAVVKIGGDLLGQILDILG